MDVPDQVAGSSHQAGVLCCICNPSAGALLSNVHGWPVPLVKSPLANIYIMLFKLDFCHIVRDTLAGAHASGVVASRNSNSVTEDEPVPLLTLPWVRIASRKKMEPSDFH